MKIIKSFLLGSAAGFVAIAGAQAADLHVKAKAVQYVKICTLYGDGYYYIPGSDTCIKVGGYIRGEYGWNVTGGRTVNYRVAAGGAQDRTVSDFSTRHRANIQMDSRTQSAYGVVRTFSSLHVNNENQGTESVNLARGFIQFAGFTFGRTESFSNNWEISDNLSTMTMQNEADTAANGVNQIAYTVEFSKGVSLTLGADEPRRKSLTSLSSATAVAIGTEPVNNHAGMSWPDPYVAFKVAQSWGQWGVSLVLHDDSATYYGTTTPTGHPSNAVGWAVLQGGELKLPFIAPGDRIGYYFNYGQGASGYSVGTLNSPSRFGSGNQVAWGPMADGYYVTGSGIELTTAWTVAGGYEHYWTKALKTSIYASYSEISHNQTVKNWFSATCGVAGTGATAQSAFTPTNCNPDWKYWSVGSRTYWSPIQGLYFALDTVWVGINSAFAGTGTIGAGNTLGARPTGGYSFNNQGFLSVAMRAQRNF
jgi:hypothetical protein